MFRLPNIFTQSLQALYAPIYQTCRQMCQPNYKQSPLWKHAVSPTLQYLFSSKLHSYTTMLLLILGDAVNFNVATKKRTDYLYIWRHNEIPVGLLARCLDAGVTTVNNDDKQNENSWFLEASSCYLFTSLNSVTNTSTYVDHKGILVFHRQRCSHLLSVCWSNFRDLENVYQSN